MGPQPFSPDDGSAASERRNSSNASSKRPRRYMTFPRLARQALNVTATPESSASATARWPCSNPRSRSDSVRAIASCTFSAQASSQQFGCSASSLIALAACFPAVRSRPRFASSSETATWKAAKRLGSPSLNARSLASARTTVAASKSARFASINHRRSWLQPMRSMSLERDARKTERCMCSMACADRPSSQSISPRTYSHELVSVSPRSRLLRSWVARDRH